jgi:hypothetical protein
MDQKIIVGVPGVKAKFQTWINSRGGVQVWNNINLSNPEARQKFTPATKIIEIPMENGGVNHDNQESCEH